MSARDTELDDRIVWEIYRPDDNEFIADPLGRGFFRMDKESYAVRPYEPSVNVEQALALMDYLHTGYRISKHGEMDQFEIDIVDGCTKLFTLSGPTLPVALCWAALELNRRRNR